MHPFSLRVLVDQTQLPPRAPLISAWIPKVRYAGEIEVKHVAVIAVEGELGNRGPARNSTDYEAGDIVLESYGCRIVQDTRVRSVVIRVWNI